MLVVIHTVRVLWTNRKVMVRMNGFYYGVKQRMDEWRNNNNNNNNIQFECEQYNLLSQFVVLVFNLHGLSMFAYYCSLIALLAYAYFVFPLRPIGANFWGINHVTIFISCVMLVVCCVISIAYSWTLTLCVYYSMSYWPKFATVFGLYRVKMG